MIPNAVKALSRLVGAALDYPAALINRETAKTDAQTKSYQQVEAAIAKVVASEAAGNVQVIGRALETLVRKQYQRQQNREAVAAETVKLLADQSANATESQPEQPSSPFDEDWLNVFERFAEDASTERMQGLWSRVLAGEIRKPGRYSARTLRFLSEFSQADGIQFAECARNAVLGLIPKKLLETGPNCDITPLIALEAAGLISGASGLGLTHTIAFPPAGRVFVREAIYCSSSRAAPAHQCRPR